MSLLIISDSHGNLPALKAALRWAVRKGPAAGLDAAVFLGDGSEDVDTASAEEGFTLPWYKVRGNGDLDLSIPASLVLEIPAPGQTNHTIVVRRLFLAHGNRYAVEAGTETLAEAARTNGAEAALFGHTHIPLWDNRNGIALLNPGSIGRPRSQAGPTFAVLSCLAEPEPSGSIFWTSMDGGVSVRNSSLKNRQGGRFLSPFSVQFFVLKPGLTIQQLRNGISANR